REGEGLEARAARLRALGDEHEVERGPVATGHEVRRALAPLILDGDELRDGWPVLHLDEELAVGGAPRRRRHEEVGREVLTAEAEWQRLLAVRAHLVARAAENGLDEGLGNPALRHAQINRLAAATRHLTSMRPDHSIL